MRMFLSPEASPRTPAPSRSRPSTTSAPPPCETPHTYPVCILQGGTRLPGALSCKIAILQELSYMYTVCHREGRGEETGNARSLTASASLASSTNTEPLNLRGLS